MRHQVPQGSSEELCGLAYRAPTIHCPIVRLQPSRSGPLVVHTVLSGLTYSCVPHALLSLQMRVRMYVGGVLLALLLATTGQADGEGNSGH